MAKRRHKHWFQGVYLPSGLYIETCRECGKRRTVKTIPISRILR